MSLTDEQLAKLARLVSDSADKEIDCAEVLNRVAAYLESLAQRAPLTEPLRPVAQHLKVCPECHEEFIGLLKAKGFDPKVLLPE